MSDTNSTPSQTKTKQPRWDRVTSTAKVAAFEASDHPGISQRQFSKQQGVSRTTLQHWLWRKATIDADPAVIAFFESPVGLAFLHRLVIALHLVFTYVGSGSIRMIPLFLELSKLDRFVAASFGAQQELSRQMQAQLSAFGAQEKLRLAPAMPSKKISICEDETFHPEICLVAIEAVSNFILVEQYAKQRDAETWNQALKDALEGLPVEVIQSTSDEAQGILSHVREELGAHHSPDLFHGQRELCKATSLSLRSQEEKARQQVEQTETQRQKAQEEFEIFLKQPPKPGFPPDFPKRIAEAKQAEAEARQLSEVAQTRREQMRAAIRGISAAHHPYDLSTAQAKDASEVERQLEARFQEIERLAEEADLSAGSRKRIGKARRLLAGFVATIAFFHLQVKMWISQLALSPEVESLVVKDLIPALYLQRVVKKLPTAEQRAKLEAVYRPLLERARDPASALGKLSAEERARIEGVAQQAADLFQQSSSCVEGRNGQLALRHHSLHRLSKSKLAALTVVHNYFLTRTDGTTAAERFFGAKPAELFDWLLDHLDMPARPARKRSKKALKSAG